MLRMFLGPWIIRECIYKLIIYLGLQMLEDYRCSRVGYPGVVFVSVFSSQNLLTTSIRFDRCENHTTPSVCRVDTGTQ